MKKLAVALCALAMISATSCKKDDANSVVDNPVPTYTEGCYQPYAQIATIMEDGELQQEWQWSGKNLDQILLTNGGNIVFSYSGKYISKVSNTGGEKQEIRYFYQGEAISKCEIYYNNVLAVTMNMTHNAGGKMSGADLTIDDNFLLNLAGSILGKGSAFEKLVGRKAAEQMILMAQLAQKDNSKFSVGSKTFTMTMVWDGENLKQQITNGNVVLNISSDDLETITSMLPLPDEAQQIVQLIQMAMMLGGGNLPINMSISDTVNVTHDANYNPFFCYWGDVVSPENLSQNNVLTMTHEGAAKLSVSMMGQTMDLMSTPFDDYTEYIYQYNDKNYPTQVSGDKNVTYTYKQ